RLELLRCQGADGQGPRAGGRGKDRRRDPRLLHLPLRGVGPPRSAGRRDEPPGVVPSAPPPPGRGICHRPDDAEAGDSPARSPRRAGEPPGKPGLRRSLPRGGAGGAAPVTESHWIPGIVVLSLGLIAGALWLFFGRKSAAAPVTDRVSDAQRRVDSLLSQL